MAGIFVAPVSSEMKIPAIQTGTEKFLTEGLNRITGLSSQSREA